MAQHDIQADVTGTVWKILVQEGDRVAEDQIVAILEAMKMEIPVVASDGGTVVTVHVQEGNAISEGDSVITLSA